MVAYMASATSILLGALVFIATYVILQFPQSGGTVMWWLLVIGVVFFVFGILMLCFLFQPWRKDFRFYSQEDKLVARLKSIEDRLEALEKAKRGE
jgi:type VI protein secretion system component VasK